MPKIAQIACQPAVATSEGINQEDELYALMNDGRLFIFHHSGPHWVELPSPADDPKHYPGCPQCGNRDFLDCFADGEKYCAKCHTEWRQK